MNTTKILFTIMGIFTISLIGCKRNNEIILKPTPVGGNFTLHSNSGIYSLIQSRGKVVLIYFGFTSCPDVCPTTLSNYAVALKKLNHDELKDTQMLFISIDPERDTLEKIQEYATFFHSNILALSGSITELQTVTALYGASFQKVKVSSGMEYTMDHTTSVFVINKEGKWVDTIPHGTSPSEIKKRILKAFGR